MISRFGLLAVKNLGRGFIDRMIEERTRKGKFSSFILFVNVPYGQDLNRPCAGKFGLSAVLWMI